MWHGWSNTKKSGGLSLPTRDEVSALPAMAAFDGWPESYRAEVAMVPDPQTLFVIVVLIVAGAILYVRHN